MIRASMVWAMAKAEARLARRLVRYWVFVVLAALLASANMVQFFFIHRMFSWGSASAAMTNPRYFVANFGANFVLVFLIGIVFLGFDLRARDKRERIVEVLDAVPCSNLELLLGRFAGLMLAAWVPVLVVTGSKSGTWWSKGPPGASPRKRSTEGYLEPAELERRLALFADVECVEIEGQHSRSVSTVDEGLDPASR